MSYSRYDLHKERKKHDYNTPYPHQSDALKHLESWFERSSTPHGALLVLPTGSGKTFTTIRFLCAGPLSANYKVLWLAHTHHLLDQAFGGFDTEVGLVSPPRTNLSLRVVSGKKKHYKPYDIVPEDDVIISTLQTITNAYDLHQRHLEAFLQASKGKLFVIFDEAHHAPAPSYRALILALRERWPELYLLGMTATPTYTDERKRGWLTKLFPQGIQYQTTAEKLMQSGVLARPRLESPKTGVVPDFDAGDYHRWQPSFGDLPDHVIEQLAGDKARNRFIAEYYVKNKEKYGKTLIFADRWLQCVELCEFLKDNSLQADVRADWIFTHTGGIETPSEDGSIADHNERVLRAFRNSELDSVANVRILTEGTDIPDLQTVFLTRQTTSKILLAQMVGRALRGPRVKSTIKENGTIRVVRGTEDAYIVSFIDNWELPINWAEWNVEEGGAEDTFRKYETRPPLDPISIERVRQLARLLDSGNLEEVEPFLTFMPIGWYRVEFYAQVEDVEEGEPEDASERSEEDHLETVRPLVPVYKDERTDYDERDAYSRFINELAHEDLSQFVSETVTLEERRSILEQWREQFSLKGIVGTTEDVILHLFEIARHMAQNGGVPPAYVPFEVRDAHDLDAIAKSVLNRDCRLSEEGAYLQEQYLRPDRYWQAIYPTYNLFWSQYMACRSRILHEPSFVEPTKRHWPNPPEVPPETKRAVKERDGYHCLCCGENYRPALQVDHVKARAVHGPINSMDNLQTLCATCNGFKGTDEIDFRKNVTLRADPAPLKSVRAPNSSQAKNVAKWEQFLRRNINFIYESAAVKAIRIGQKGRYFREWDVELFLGNDPNWLQAYLPGYVATANRVRERAGLDLGIESINVH